MTVAQFLNRWLQDCVKPSVRPRTYRSYTDVVRLHINPTLGPIFLAKLSAQDVQHLVNDRLKAKVPVPTRRKATPEEPEAEQPKTRFLSPRTVQYVHAVLSRALNRAVKWDLVPRNVCKVVTPPRVPRRPVEPLSVGEAKHFLDVIKGDRNEALYSVAMALGLRKGEALGLRWPDIDLNAATVSVRHALQRVDGKRQLVEPKSDRSHRTLPLPDFAGKALRSHRTRQLEERLLAGSQWTESGHVFTTTIGTPLDERKVLKDFKKALMRAKLPAKRFHDLRHTAASLLLAQGVQARSVMEVLGHSQISLTMNTYAHVMPTLLQDAADKMQAALGGRE